MLRAACLYSEGAAEDIGEFGAIAILPADNLLLPLVVVAAREKVAEDELGCPDLLCGVHLDWDSVAVILYSDTEGLPFRSGLSNSNVNVLDGGSTGLPTTYEGITGIYKNLVENLVEARIECNVAANHFPRSLIKCPARLLMCLCGANIGVWQLQDVLAVSEFLKGRGSGHFYTKGGGLGGGQFYCPS